MERRIVDAHPYLDKGYLVQPRIDASTGEQAGEYSTKSVEAQFLKNMPDTSFKRQKISLFGLAAKIFENLGIRR